MRPACAEPFGLERDLRWDTQPIEVSLMNPAIRYTAAACLFGMLGACTQPGDEHLRPEVQAAAAPDAACFAGTDCTAFRPASLTEPRPPVRPAVPPVPDSPIKANCAQLPTQIERDTCTNRKESTG
jgi:hypothetical protein